MAIREKAKKLDKILGALEKHYSKSVLPEGKDLLERFLVYLLFYDNPVTNARKAVKTFLDESLFGDWNEVRVATHRELEDILREARIENADKVAPQIKNFLQQVFEELDDTALEPGAELKADKARKFLTTIEGLPPHAVTYLMVALGLESAVPWDAHTERVAGRVRLFDPAAPLVQRKKQLRAALQDEDPIRAHHLFVEHGKKTCTEEDPKCPKCPINKDCEYYLRRGARGAKKDAASEADPGVAVEPSTNGNGKEPPAKKAAKGAAKDSKKKSK